MADGSMRAVFLQPAESGSGAARLTECPAPAAPGPGEIRVNMLLAPVNPADLLMLAGQMAGLPQENAIIGAEGVGRIDAIGAGVDGLAVGDRVSCLDRGNWAEQRMVSADRVVRVPKALSDIQAAMLRINPPTAWRLLDLAGLQPGDWLVQNGATTMVGRLVCLLAQEFGLRTACVVRDVARATPVLTAFGAGVILADGPDLAARLWQATGGERPKLGLDCVAGEATGWLAGGLDEGAALTVFGQLSHQACVIPPGLLTAGRIRINGFSLRPAEAGQGRRELQPLFDKLAETVAAFPAIFPETELFPLEALQDALALAGPKRALLELARSR